MEELAKKIIEIEGIQYVPWSDVVNLLEATKTETLTKGLLNMETALQNLQQALSELNNTEL